MKKIILFAMVAVAVMMASCKEYHFEDPKINPSEHAWGIHDSIKAIINDHTGIDWKIVYIAIEGETPDVKISHDTVYVYYPVIVEHTTETIHDTTIIEHGYVIVVDYGTEESVFVKEGEPCDSIFVTFISMGQPSEERFVLDPKSEYFNGYFVAHDSTKYLLNDKAELADVNERHGEILSNKDTVFILNASTSIGKADPTSAVYGTPDGTRNGLTQMKDSCTYTYISDQGVEYKMQIAARNLRGQNSKSDEKQLHYLSPTVVNVEVNNDVDKATADTIHRNGRICYKVRQFVKATFVSKRMPQQGSEVTYEDVVTADSEGNIEMPVVYLIGDSIPVLPVDTLTPEPKDTSDVDDPGYIFPNGKVAAGGYTTVTPRTATKTFEEGQIIYTETGIYMFFEGQCVGYFATSTPSMYNSMYFDGMTWKPAYVEEAVNGNVPYVVWYHDSSKNATYKAFTVEHVSYAKAHGQYLVSTNMVGGWVRELQQKNVGNTTKFFVDGKVIVVASDGTVDSKYK